MSIAYCNFANVLHALNDQHFKFTHYDYCVLVSFRKHSVYHDLALAARTHAHGKGAQIHCVNINVSYAHARVHVCVSVSSKLINQCLRADP